MVTTYLCKNLVEWTTSKVVKQLKSNLMYMMTLRYRCGKHFFCDCQTKRCHGNHTFYQNLVEQTASTAFNQLRSNFVCMMIYKCSCARQHLCSCQTKCYHGNYIFLQKSWSVNRILKQYWYMTCTNICNDIGSAGAGVLITLSDISSCSWSSGLQSEASLSWSSGLFWVDPYTVLCWSCVASRHAMLQLSLAWHP